MIKAPYFLLNSADVAIFLIFKTVFMGSSEILPYIWKNITKMSGIFVWNFISSPNFQKIGIYLVNTHIFWYIDMLDVTASYWMAFDFIALLAILIHYYWTFMSEVMYLSMIVCTSSTHILICQHARYDCKLWKASWFYCLF